MEGLTNCLALKVNLYHFNEQITYELYSRKIVLVDMNEAAQVSSRSYTFLLSVCGAGPAHDCKTQDLFLAYARSPLSWYAGALALSLD